jgi:cyclic pyranopterin phosphate synthase
MKRLTHLRPDTDIPDMVNITNKPSIMRSAHAQARVTLPPDAMHYLIENGMTTKKGSVIQVSILAGIMGAKRTGELIPLCHTLSLTGCSIDIQQEGNDFVIDCLTSTHAQTGVEMEALTGAGIAALTLYDMCKSLLKGTNESIQIREIILLEKIKSMS